MKTITRSVLAVLFVTTILSAAKPQNGKPGNYYVLDFPKDSISKYYNDPSFNYFVFVLHKSLVTNNYQLEATAFDHGNNIINTFQINKIDNNQKVSLPNVFNHGIYILTKTYMTAKGMTGDNECDLTPVQSLDGKFVSYTVSGTGPRFTTFDLNPSPPGGVSTYTGNTIHRRRGKPHGNEKK